MRSKISTGRGRPPGKHHSRVDFRLLEYLSRISMKYGVDADKFFSNLVEAWNHQESTFKGITIECRRRRSDHAVFLITNSSRVIAQFKMSEHLLKEGSPLKEFISLQPAFQKSSRKAQENARERRITDLRFGMKKVRVKAQILEMPQPRLVFTRFGSSAKVTNALVGDETGTIKLSLWNNQIDAVSVGDRIQIDNAHVASFRGELQLRISRQGKMNLIKSSN